MSDECTSAENRIQISVGGLTITNGNIVFTTGNKTITNGTGNILTLPTSTTTLIVNKYGAWNIYR